MVAGAGYFFAGIGIVLCLGLGLAVVLQPDLLAYLLRWAVNAGLSAVIAVVSGCVIAGAGVAVALRLAKRGSL